MHYNVLVQVCVSTVYSSEILCVCVCSSKSKDVFSSDHCFSWCAIYMMVATIHPQHDVLTWTYSAYNQFRYQYRSSCTIHSHYQSQNTVECMQSAADPEIKQRGALPPDSAILGIVRMGIKFICSRAEEQMEKKGGPGPPGPRGAGSATGSSNTHAM